MEAGATKCPAGHFNRTVDSERGHDCFGSISPEGAAGEQSRGLLFGSGIYRAGMEVPDLSHTETLDSEFLPDESPPLRASLVGGDAPQGLEKGRNSGLAICAFRKRSVPPDGQEHLVQSLVRVTKRRGLGVY